MSFQPEKITREHVLKAIKDIDDGVLAVRPSTKFDIVYKGKTYPPKDVMRFAHEYATGEYLWIPGGGEPTNKYLKELQFQIIQKTDHLNMLNVKEEFIDWMVANISGGNYFKNQFASNRERFENEINEYEVKYKENFNSELFIFSSTNYKNEIELIRTNLYNTSTLFSEYSNNLASGRPKAMLGKKNYLRFLEERFGTLNAINYWIFQGNPKIYNAVKALNANAVKTWTVSAHKDNIKKGDKFILWQTGTNAGCYALGTIASEVRMMKEETAEMAYYLIPTPQIDNNRVKIVIEQNFANNPILWDEIKELPELAEFKAGNQGTNFSATKAEYDFFNSNKIPKSQTKDIMSSNNLNQILFGPPGTGKTFNTINEALKIVDPSYFEEHQNDRIKLTDRFKELLIKNSEENKGQIAFCTFHQSFSYEDFVEGIKPKTTDTKSIYYDVEPGIFKRICQLADSYNSTVKVKSEGKLSWDEEQYKRASFYKLSLGEAYTSKDREIYEYCRDNGYISMGFGAEYDFTGLSESEIVEKCADLKLEGTSAQQLNYFIHYLKKNNYVIISNGNKYVRAIGKVIGNYEYVAESPIQYNQFRKVEWIFVDENIPIEEIYDKGLSQKTMYKIDESLLKKDFFTNNGQETLEPVKEEKNYVLIIDEINRGNVSSIFGELITLIEKDKRAGCDEELEVTLPYSKEPFKVPNNVYLIGTMNTADRSIEALDTALRRRFSFKEFPPKTHLIKTEGASGNKSGMIDGIDLEKLLITINTRIEKLIDKDHRIGHSYFLKVDTKKKLVHAFKNEIIPLLEEYFFGDYGKIGLVLGASFVEKVNHDFSFAEFAAYDSDIQSDLKEKAVFRIQHEDLWDFSKI